MPHLFILLLKINFVLVLFAAAYYLILRRLTFYTLNRVFLVFGIVFSSVYPFIDLTDFLHRQQQLSPQVVRFVPQLNQKVNSLVPTNFITSNWGFISVIFYLGVALMAMRLIVQFISLYQMHRKSAPGSIADYKVRILSEPVSPFSFWQTVYVNPSLHQEKELQTILAHEDVHVKQWHSLDIILAELSVVFYWFNPGVWMMKKAVKENLEFITDQKILNNGIDRKTYQYSLLDVGNLNAVVPIVNNFNLSDLKKRIKMMNVKRSSKLTLSRYLLVTPVLLVTTLAFTVSKKEFKKHFMPLRQALIAHQLVDAPKELPSASSQQFRSRKRVAVTGNPHRPDSAHTFHILIKKLFINGDTVRIVRADGLKLDNSTLLRQVAEGPEQVTSTSYAYSTDTLKGGGTKTVQLQFRHKQPSTGIDGNERYIVVNGFKKQAGSLDSAIANGNVVFFLNGKKVDPETVNRDIDPNNIKRVTMRKDKVLAGVHIVTKTQP